MFKRKNFIQFLYFSLMVLLLGSAVGALAASNTVPISYADDINIAIDQSIFLPTQCATMRFDNVIYGEKDLLNPITIIIGTDRNDLIYGTNGNDEIYGDNGHDCIIGGGGDDKLFGDNGKDVLVGGPGFDYIRGGNGTDLCYFGEDVDECEN
jgi:Ca2+-binding RTX toxin-like protein